MRVISRGPLRNFANKPPQATEPLDAWYRRVRHAYWKSPADVKQDYGTADILPDNRIIFNIGGNNYRLIVGINYHRQALYVRFIGTHAEYDCADATTVYARMGAPHSQRSRLPGGAGRDRSTL